ncbi:MAG: cadmium-translocating P-type ATPase [Rhodospirillales bacterium]|nr:cadmium-translocating P-type ATPase [Rhodospirillales bacterium]MCB9980568.1 cadmium-translocating P-type ATPase [Rhodospirillales bacterium]
MDGTEHHISSGIPNRDELSQSLEARESVDFSGYEGLVKPAGEGRYALSLLIGGVHCAACIQKIESTLLQDPRIEQARLNFTTGRLQIIWTGPAAAAGHFAAQVANLGYTVAPYSTESEKGEAEREDRFLLLCLGVAGFAMGNIMLLSVGLWSTSTETMGLATRELMNWVSALIGIPTIAFSGRPFFRSAWGALKNRQTNMDVPISLALLLATGMSIFEMLHDGEHVYFDSAVMLTFFLLVGRYLDFRARRTAKSAALDLMSTLSGFANILEQGKSRRVPIRDLREGMVVSVAVGEKFPVDGVVTSGHSTVDTSLVTGETVPRTVAEGTDVYAGTLNLSAPVLVTVAKAAQDSLLADIVRLMEKAEQGQAKYVRLADRAARLYTPVVHTLAAAAFVLWWGVLGAAWQDALMIAVTVLIITCPCALGLAVPVVQVLASGRLMKKGIMLKSGDALERLAGIDTVIVDKTGTLTLGRPQLQGDYLPEILQLAASLATQSRHPLARAIVSAWDGNLVPVEAVQEHQGKGLSALYQGHEIRLGSRNWCGDPAAAQQNDLELWLAPGNGQKPVRFIFEDHLRTDAVETIAVLQKKGIRPVLLSGDRTHVAERIAAACHIDDVKGDQTPPQKYAYLQALKAQGHHVLMIGDGLNDAPALAGADVSMAPGTAIDMAQNAADIVFMGDQFKPVLQAYDIATRTQQLVKSNFALAVIYNAIAIPLAFAGVVTPLIAALAMSGSSLLVIANSFRLYLVDRRT